MATTEEQLKALSENVKKFIDKVTRNPGLYASFSGDLQRLKLKSMEENLVRKLLKELNVGYLQWGRYIRSQYTVHELLLGLRGIKESEETANDLLEAMDKAVKSTAWRKGIFVTVIALIGLSPLFFLGGLTAIQTMLTGASTIPSVSLSYTLGAAIVTLFPRLLDPLAPADPKEESFWIRFKRNFFALSGLFIQASAYVVILAALATGPVVMALFVAASVMQVLHEISSYISHTEPEDEVVGIDETPQQNLERNQMHARFKSEHAMKKYEIMINIVAAAALTLLVAASFIPPFMLPAYLGMGLVFIVKRRVLQSNQIRAKGELESAFALLEAKSTVSALNENGASPGNTYSLISSLPHAQGLTANAVDAGNPSQKPLNPATSEDPFSAKTEEDPNSGNLNKRSP